MGRYTVLTWVGGLSVVEMSVFPRLSCVFIMIPADITAGLFVVGFCFFLMEIDKLILHFVGNAKVLEQSKFIRKRTRLENKQLPTFKANPDNVCWHKDRQIDQRNRVESRTDLCVHRQLIFYQSANAVQWEKSIIFE